MNMSMPSYVAGSASGGRVWSKLYIIPATGGVCRAGGGHGALPSPLRADGTCAVGSGRRSGCWWTAVRRRHLAVARVSALSSRTVLGGGHSQQRSRQRKARPWLRGVRTVDWATGWAQACCIVCDRSEALRRAEAHAAGLMLGAGWRRKSWRAHETKGWDGSTSSDRRRRRRARGRLHDGGGESVRAGRLRD